jgi:hypothetical protein
MNRILVPSICALGLVASTHVHAEPDALKKPVVERVPDSARWELIPATADFKPAQPAGDDAPSRVVITRSGAVQKVEMGFASGQSRVVWMANGEMFLDINNVVSSGKLQGWVPELYNATTTYFGTDWVTPDKLKGQVTINNLLCDVYETYAPRSIDRTAATMMGADPEKLSIHQMAWIDPVTKRPVAVLTPEGTYLYRFLDPPASPLVLPPAFRAKQKEREEEIARQQAEASAR